jgi:hypothetical protein
LALKFDLEDFHVGALDLLLELAVLNSVLLNLIGQALQLLLTLLLTHLELVRIPRCLPQGVFERRHLLTDIRCAGLSLLLRLRLVLQLDRLTLVDSALHLLYQLLLLPLELLQLDFHTMNLLLHISHLDLPDVWVNGLLHLTLELGLTLPKQDLTLAFHDLLEDHGLLVLEPLNTVLKLNCLCLELLQTDLEVFLQVVVLILQLVVHLLVLRQQQVDLVHVILQRLQPKLQRLDVLLRKTDITVKPYLPLLENSLLGLLATDLLIDLV